VEERERHVHTHGRMRRRGRRGGRGREEMKEALMKQLAPKLETQLVKVNMF